MGIKSALYAPVTNGMFSKKAKSNCSYKIKAPGDEASRYAFACAVGEIRARIEAVAELTFCESAHVSMTIHGGIAEVSGDVMCRQFATHEIVRDMADEVSYRSHRTAHLYPLGVADIIFDLEGSITLTTT